MYLWDYSMSRSALIGRLYNIFRELADWACQAHDVSSLHSSWPGPFAASLYIYADVLCYEESVGHQSSSRTAGSVWLVGTAPPLPGDVGRLYKGQPKLPRHTILRPASSQLDLRRASSIESSLAAPVLRPASSIYRVEPCLTPAESRIQLATFACSRLRVCTIVSELATSRGKHNKRVSPHCWSWRVSTPSSHQPRPSGDTGRTKWEVGRDSNAMSGAVGSHPTRGNVTIIITEKLCWEGSKNSAQAQGRSRKNINWLWGGRKRKQTPSTDYWNTSPRTPLQNDRSLIVDPWNH